MSLPWIDARVTVFSGTTKEWTDATMKGNIVLLKDELAVEWNNANDKIIGFKLGDGINVFNNLNYVVAPVKYVNIEDGRDLPLENNTIYITKENETISSLNITYPEGHFICSLIFTVGDISSGTNSISFPIDSKYIGTKPDFNEGETWEINIMDRYITSAKAVSE
jgi:hypothetical protein